MSTARDNGLAALQSGDAQTAIAQLEIAIQEDPSDYDAFQYLGGAYGLAERHLDAIKSFTQAVQLQPANAQARYNLGVAMENGGYEEQALQVYDQAIQLQHDYPQAHDALKRLEGKSNDGFGAPVASAPSAAPDSAQAQGTSSASHGFGAQESESPLNAQPQQPAQPFAPSAAFGQPAAAPLAQPTAAYGAPTQAFPPPQAQQPAYGQPVQNVVPAAQQPVQFGAPMRPQQPVAQAGEEPGLGSYMAPPVATPTPPAFGQSTYGAPGGGYGARPSSMPYRAVPDYEDSFNPLKAVADLFKAAFTPVKFFSEQVGCESVAGPWAAILCFSVVILLAQVGSHLAVPESGGVTPALIHSVGAILTNVVTWIIFALIVKLLSGAFGASLGYGASFRAVVYSAAPFMAALFAVSVMSGSSDASKAALLSGMPGSSVRTTSPLRGQPVMGNQPSTFPARPGAQTGNPYAPTGGSTAGVPDFGSLMAQGMMQLVVFLIAVPWCWVLLGIALTNIHELSSGSAAGTVILSVIVMMVVGFVFGLVIFFLGLASALGIANAAGGH